MRIWLLLVAWLVVPGWALAKPTIAIAPLDGDRGNKVGNALAEVLEDDAKVVRPKVVKKAITKLRLKGELESRDLKKLRGELGADVIIQGTLAEDGKKQRLALSLGIKGKRPSRILLRFKDAGSEDFRDEVRDKLAKRLDGVDDAAEDKSTFRKEDKQDDKKRERSKRVAERDDDDAKADKKKRKKKKKKKSSRRDRDDDDDEDEDGDGPGVRRARHPVTQAAVRLHAGASVGRRSLTYDSTTTPPQPVGTFAAAGRIEGEVYPFSFDSLKGPIAGLGLAGEYGKTVGLSIKNIPGTTAEAPIDEGHYSIGVRYRIPLGSSALAFGVSYARRHFIADRSALATPGELDAPDVDYTAIAPGVTGRIAATPTIGVFASAEALLMLSTGQIQENESYGPADVIAFEIDGGVEIALAPHYGLRFVAEVTQIGFTFKASPGTMAAARGVTGATDRIIGLAATLAVTY